MNGKMVKASELAALVKGEFSGPGDPMLSALADLESAGAGEVSFVGGKVNAAELKACRASVQVVRKDCPELALPTIRVDDPVWAATAIHTFFLTRDFVATGIHPSAVIGRDCTIPEEVSIGPLVCVGDRVRLGRRVRLGPGCVLGDDVVLGDDCLLHPNVTVLAGSQVGARVVMHSGVVVGSDGFGYAHDRLGRHLKRPHVGHVRIDDDVELGANVCVDRATFGRTWIKRGTKIDNLVQIGHNVEIGEDSILVSQVGLSGSTVLGDGVVMGGKAGTSGHLRIGNRATVAGMCGVTSDVKDGEVVAGFPSMAHWHWLRMVTSLPRLPDLVKEFRELKKQLARLLADGATRQD